MGGDRDGREGERVRRGGGRGRCRRPERGAGAGRARCVSGCCTRVAPASPPAHGHFLSRTARPPPSCCAWPVRGRATAGMFDVTSLPRPAPLPEPATARWLAGDEIFPSSRELGVGAVKRWGGCWGGGGGTSCPPIPVCGSWVGGRAHCPYSTAGGARPDGAGQHTERPSRLLVASGLTTESLPHTLAVGPTTGSAGRPGVPVEDASGGLVVAATACSGVERTTVFPPHCSPIDDGSAPRPACPSRLHDGDDGWWSRPDGTRACRACGCGHRHPPPLVRQPRQGRSSRPCHQLRPRREEVAQARHTSSTGRGQLDHYRPLRSGIAACRLCLTLHNDRPRR